MNKQALLLHKYIRNLVPCPECGNRDDFSHVANKAKGWNFWGCRACGASFSDDNGRPGPKREKKEPVLTEFVCEKCGKPLQHVKGERDGRSWDFFACSDRECGAKYDNEDGKPVIRAGPELSEHKCRKCGKPLAVKPTKTGGIWFACTGYPKCKQRYWDKGDGTPDFDNPPK